jgi:Family of unknown function (DUF6348)
MPDATPTLHDLLANHGVATTTEAYGWLSTDGSYPACRAYTNESPLPNGGYRLRFDVEVALSADRLMIESFSDLGADRQAALRSSLQSFCTGSLHVMLSGLWGVTDPNQVLVEECTIGEQAWVLHLGNLIRKAEGGIDVPPPDDLMPRFDNLLQQAEIAPTLHWGRIYYANMPTTENIVEVLLDNQPWLAGESAVRAAAWPTLKSFYSVRMFWIMVPKAPAA